MPTLLLNLLTKFLELVQQFFKVQKLDDRRKLDEEVRKDPLSVWQREFGVQQPTGSPSDTASTGTTDETAIDESATSPRKPD